MGGGILVLTDKALFAHLNQACGRLSQREKTDKALCCFLQANTNLAKQSEPSPIDTALSVRPVVES